MPFLFPSTLFLSPSVLYPAHAFDQPGVWPIPVAGGARENLPHSEGSVPDNLAGGCSCLLIWILDFSVCQIPFSEKMLGCQHVVYVIPVFSVSLPFEVVRCFLIFPFIPVFESVPRLLFNLKLLANLQEGCSFRFLCISLQCSLFNVRCFPKLQLPIWYECISSK